MENKKDPTYQKTKEEIEEAINDVIKDYKAPTEHMNLQQKIEFNKAMQKLANKTALKLAK